MCGPCANFRQIQQQIVDQIDLSACSETRGLQYATGFHSQEQTQLWPKTGGGLYLHYGQHSQLAIGVLPQAVHSP